MNQFKPVHFCRLPNDAKCNGACDTVGSFVFPDNFNSPPQRNQTKEAIKLFSVASLDLQNAILDHIKSCYKQNMTKTQVCNLFLQWCDQQLKEHAVI